MTLAISGASGFVGSYLQNYFINKGHQVLTFSRNDFDDPSTLERKVAKADVIINLAGASILKRWSPSYKKLLLNSRVNTTQALVQAINKQSVKPLLISTSAIGIYKKDKLYDETSTSYDTGFLSQVCQAWEAEALKANTRVAIFRFSVILGKGGALEKMLLPFKLGLGGRVASGKQAFSYIHIQDLARAYEHIIENDTLHGIFNLSTPYPVDNKTLTQTLAHKLKRPAIFPLPAWVVKIIFGEGANTLIQGEQVYPKHLLDTGFSFVYPQLEDILEDLL